VARTVRTLWFRERGFIDEPIITLPFVGDVPPRRLIWATAFGTAFLIINALLLSLSEPYVVAILALCALLGWVIGTPRPIPIEKRLLYLIGLRSRTGEVKSSEVRSSKIIVPANTPLRVVGRASGKVVIEVDGIPTQVKTNSLGEYEHEVILKPGAHTLRVVQEGVVLYSIVIEAVEK